MLGAEFAGQALAYWATLVDRPEPVTTGIEEVLGRKARPFQDWAHHHRLDFEQLTTQEVGEGYARAFRTGRRDEAGALLAQDIVRIAPLEDGGVERDASRIIREEVFYYTHP